MKNRIMEEIEDLYRQIFLLEGKCVKPAGEEEFERELGKVMEEIEKEVSEE